MSKEQKNVPKLRFPGFTGEWEQQKLEGYLKVSQKKNKDGVYDKEDVLSVSGDYGIVNQIEFQGRSFAGESVANYGVVETGDVVYTKSPLKSNPYGIIKTNKGQAGIVSTLYAVYRPKFNTCSDFIQVYFELDARMNNYMRPLVNKGAKNDMKVSAENALKGEVCFPSRAEQETISEFFAVFDTLTALHQRKLDQIKEYKKGMLQKMFPKEGEMVPEVRFPGFSGEWERMRLGDFIRFAGGATPSKNNTAYWNGDIVWLSSQEINKGGFIDCGTYTITQKAIDDGTTRIVKANTPLIISRSGILAHSFPVTRSRIDAAINQDIKALIFDKKRYSTDFIVFLMEQKAPYILKSIVKTGTTVQSVNMPDLEKMDVLIPRIDEQQQVGSFFLELDTLITLHQRKLDAMKEYKKGLLQQMFV